MEKVILKPQARSSENQLREVSSQQRPPRRDRWSKKQSELDPKATDVSTQLEGKDVQYGGQ
jgi:hypothetical protein